jgi:RNA polymerase sigma factor (sigma-70 family)
MQAKIYDLPREQWEKQISAVISKLNIRTINKIKKMGLMEDLRMEAWLGIAKAKEKFNPSLGISFSTYAHWYMAGYIKNFCHRERKYLDIAGNKFFFHTSGEFNTKNMIETTGSFVEDICSQYVYQSEEEAIAIEKEVESFIIKNFSAQKITNMTDVFINNKSYADTGRKHGVTREWVRKVVGKECINLAKKYKDYENIIIN